jgi:hypothetical protein
MKQLIYFFIVATFCACRSTNELDSEAETPEEVSVENDTLEEDHLSNPVDKIDTIGINEFWSQQDLNSATLYVYAPEFKSDEDRLNTKLILDEHGKVNLYTIDSLTTELDSDALATLRQYLITETTFDETPANCFDPRHGIVFKDSKGRVVGHISICISCTVYAVKPEPARFIPMAVFEKLIAEAGVPTEASEIQSIFRESDKYVPLDEGED